MTDVFDLQEEIAKAIATRLRGALADESARTKARSGTKNLEAYELLLKGRALLVRRGRFLGEAIATLERAVEADPGYAEALAWLADSYRLMGTFGMAPYSEVMPKAKAMAERALAIDDSLPEAWAALACVVEQYEWRFPEAARIWERALSANPRHGQSRSQRALWGFMVSSFTTERALAESRQAVQDDPLNPWVIAMHSYMLSLAGHHEESLAEARRSFALDTESFFSHWNLMRALAWAGEWDRAIEMAPALLNASGRQIWVLGTLAWCYAKQGEKDRARGVYDEAEGRSRHEFVSPFWLATMASCAGLHVEMLRHARRAVHEHDPLIVWGRKTVFWDDVRPDPEIDEIVSAVWQNVKVGAGAR
jgi:serine/threonine-protein kinase